MHRENQFTDMKKHRRPFRLLCFYFSNL